LPGRTGRRHGQEKEIEMGEKPGLCIRENPPLIPEDLVIRARKLSSSLISDAMESFGAMDCHIKPVAPTMKVAGTAMTVMIRPGDNLLLHKATYLSRKGYVLVADQQGYASGAAWGEMMTRAAMAVGVEGVVLDGVVRDLKELKELGFPVFAKGAIPNGLNRFGPGEINGIISCGGISVHPGDLIFGDEDGVVVVPRAEIEAVLVDAEAKAVQEKKRIQEIAQGKLEPAWIDERLRQLGLLD
jgi:4-hydroxy-4-methyl-2-oxoglutarate aldolase